MKATLAGAAATWGWPDPPQMGREWFVRDDQENITRVVVAKETLHGKPIAKSWVYWCEAHPGESHCLHARFVPVPKFDTALYSQSQQDAEQTDADELAGV